MLLLVSAPASQSSSFVWRSAGGHSQPCLSAARQLGGLSVQHQTAMLSMLHMCGAKTVGFCSADVALLGVDRSAVILWCFCGLVVVVVKMTCNDGAGWLAGQFGGDIALGLSD